MNYYNDNDPKACAWLRELIAADLIAPGDVDERPIEEVQAVEVDGYTQCHFFAGIGGWALALDLAGWPRDRPVWTGSCPCQPFSVAGGQGVVNDPRHLWPAFRALIAECKPSTIFGEQVSSTDGLRWLAGVRLDLESIGYAVGAADLPACSVGALHRRQRIWWVADADSIRRERVRTDATPRNWSRAEFARRVKSELRTGVPAGAAGRVHDGIPGSLDAVRGYGCSIVPQVAAEFIGAYLDAV